MTDVFDGMDDIIENTFGESIVYDPSGVAKTIQADVEIGFKPVGALEQIEIPPILTFSQNTLDSNSITLALTDVIEFRSVNYVIVELSDDGRGSVKTAMKRQAL